MAPQYEARLVLPGFDERLKTFEKIVMREASIRELILLGIMSLPKTVEPKPPTPTAEAEDEE